MGTRCTCHSAIARICDLIAEDGPKLLRVQVKTSTVFFKNRWAVAVCTKGGNQSWSGLVKRLDPTRIDYLLCSLPTAVAGSFRRRRSEVARRFISADRSTPLSKSSLIGLSAPRLPRDR